MTGIIK